MSKKIDVNMGKWVGSVIIADPINIPQAKLIEIGISSIPDEEIRYAPNGSVWLTVENEKQLPAILACVEAWELTNFPEKVSADTFPASPRGQSAKLIKLLFDELLTVWKGEAQVPNE